MVREARSDRGPDPGKAPYGRLSVYALGVLTGLSLVALEGRRPRAPKAEIQQSQSPEAPGLAAVARATWAEFNADQIPAVAAGATFFCLLALFPALGVFVSFYGLFADVEQARRYVLDLHGVLPAGAISVLGDQLDRLAHTPHVRLGWTFGLGLMLSIWSANAGMKSLMAGLNVAYQLKERRNFWALNAASLALTLGAIMAALAATALMAWLSVLGLTGSLSALLVQWAVLLALFFVALSALYGFGPSRAGASWRWITPGSGFSAAAWLVMSILFTLYVANFGHYDRLYGALGAVIGFMTWIWLSLCVVLLGAELNSHFE